jgi:hypothetical protein
MALTAAGVAGLALVFWLLFHWLNIFAKTRTVLALVAAIGLGGFIGRALVRVVTWLTHLTGTVTGWALGVALPSALFLVLAIILIHDLHPKHGASRRTAYIAFGAGALLVAGVTGIPALAPAASALQSLPANIAGFVSTL